MGDGRFDAIDLEEDAARLDLGDESYWITLTLSHLYFGRLLREWVIGEDADPDFAGLRGVTGHDFTSRFDLVGSDASVLHGFQTKRTEGQVDAARLYVSRLLLRVRAHSEPLAMFYFFGE